MIADVLRVLEQLPDPKLLRPMLLGLIVSALVLAILLALTFWLLSGISLEGGGWLAEALDSIGALEIAGTVGAGWLALLLFPAVALAIQGIFLDGVAEAVESRHYPTLPTARDVPLLESVGSAVKLTGLVLLVNFLLLPVYLFLLLIPPTGLLLYYAVNGYLVGREYFEEVGLRRESSVELKATRRRNRAKIWMDGILLTLVFTIPVVNLAGPTLGAAYMVHRYHRIAGNRGHAHV